MRTAVSVSALFRQVAAVAPLLLTACGSMDDGLKYAANDQHDALVWGHRDLAAAAPYEYYPTEYYILRGHPSQYYYTYPDRYYARRYRYVSPLYEREGYRYPSGPGLWHEEGIYGYRGPILRKGFRGQDREDGKRYRRYYHGDCGR